MQNNTQNAQGTVQYSGTNAFKYILTMTQLSVLSAWCVGWPLGAQAADDAHMCTNSPTKDNPPAFGLFQHEYMTAHKGFTAACDGFAYKYSIVTQ